jgi:hypothetical protein
MFSNNDNDYTSSAALIDRLTREAGQFRAQSDRCDNARMTFLIADFEFAYDQYNFDRYKAKEGDQTEGKCRWPFHHLVAGAWCQVTFVRGLAEPVVSQPAVLTADTHAEIAIAKAYFAAVEAAGDSVLVGWGSEQKDVPVLRRIASENGIPLPRALIDTNPWSRFRLDLCNSVSAQAPCPHLPEYCMATGIPTKPMPSKDVGKAVLNGAWAEVAEQVLADLGTISVIAVRHAIAHHMVVSDLDVAEQAVALAIAKALPTSVFLQQAPIRLRMHRCQPWTARAV